MSGVSDLKRLRADAARRAGGHGHGGRLPERLAVPEPVAIIAPVLLLAILHHLHPCQLRVRRAVLWAVGDEPDLQHAVSIQQTTPIGAAMFSGRRLIGWKSGS